MNPIVSQMVAEDRMATRLAEAAAYRRGAGRRPRRMRWARQVVAGALVRLATALDPSLREAASGAARARVRHGFAFIPVDGRR